MIRVTQWSPDTLTVEMKKQFKLGHKLKAEDLGQRGGLRLSLCPARDKTIGE